MKDIIAGSIVILVLFGILFRIVIDRDYKMKQKCVEDIVYTYTQVVSKKGQLQESIYNQMNEKLRNFGEFEIKVKAEKFLDETDDILVIEGEKDLVDQNLRQQGFDIVTIYVQSKKEHIITHLYSNGYQYKLNALASAPIF